MSTPTRRRFLQMALGAPALVRAQSSRRATFSFTQYHNQTAASSLHRQLVGMWAAIARETGGRVEAAIFPENNHVAGSDPAALSMLVDGRIQFFTLMGGILGAVVPAAEVQQVPFAFSTAQAAHRAMDGPLGRYVAGEMSAKGIHGFAVSAFDNGMRQIASRTKPVGVPGDLEGMKMRVPDGRIFTETFAALGAEPVTINVDGIYGALASGRVDAQENPLAVVDLFRLYEVVRFVSMTNHMWSGFNLIANRPTWMRLPADVRGIIERHVTRAVRAQRREQMAANAALPSALAARGLAIGQPVDPRPFRARLSGVYATWRERLGRTCWGLLEAETGKL